MEGVKKAIMKSGTQLEVEAISIHLYFSINGKDLTTEARNVL